MIKLSNNKKGIIFLAIALLLVGFVVSNKNTSLAEYKEPPTVEVEETKSYSTTLYLTDNFSIPYPTGWTPVNDGNICQFIDTATATTIELSLRQYTPSLNILNEPSVASNLSNNGYELSKFTKLSNCCYRAEYHKDRVAYIETVYWDYNNMYTVLGKYKPEYYNSVYDLITYCSDHFEWKGNIIPLGYHVNYYPDKGFAPTIKDSWGVTEDESTVYINDSEFGTYIEITTYNTAEDYSDVTQLMLTEYSSIGKENYIQSSFSNTGDKITSVATYTINGEKVEQYQYHIATGERQYKINIEFYNSQAENVYNSVQIFIDNFRYY